MSPATVDLRELVEALTRPAAYPFPVADIEVRQTHISIVFLAGPYVYKVKKPVHFDFLDCRTLEKRRHFCDEEVRLNRRLAAEVYLGVVPITAAACGLLMEGAGEAIEWAVKMQRLPEAATLRECVRRGAADTELAERLGWRIAAFHREVPAPPDGARYSSFEAVARNLRDIFAQSAHQVGQTVSSVVHEQTRTLVEAELLRRGALIETRSARGMTRANHGDLRLEHVYYFPDRPPPADLLAIDCIEFNERYRFTDPVADVAFLVMDFARHDRRDLGGAFADAYFRAADDAEGRSLLPLYTAYRATVRGLVDGLTQEEKEVPIPARQTALASARAYWLLALGELEAPLLRPALILLGGLPGSGKSTLARALAPRAGFHVLRSDVIRKELAGLPPEQPAPPSEDAGLYSAAWAQDTYAELLRRAEALLWNGQRVLIDASSQAEWQRLLFVQAAQRWGVAMLFLHCQAAPAIIQLRLQKRQGDASDADWSVYQLASAAWEAPSAATLRITHTLQAEGPIEEMTSQALLLLGAAGLV